MGFRKDIPVTVKLDVVIRQEGRCKTCGERLGDLKSTQFDHVPAIQLRGWDPGSRDTLPPASCPEHIEAKHKSCHAVKTTGRKGESKLNAIHGDTAEIAKLRRLTRDEIAFRQRLLAKAEGNTDEEQTPQRKSRWPKRSFPRRVKHGPSAERAEDPDAGDEEHSLH